VLYHTERRKVRLLMSIPAILKYFRDNQIPVIGNMVIAENKEMKKFIEKFLDNERVKHTNGFWVRIDGGENE
jgi:hypothetical protein